MLFESLHNHTNISDGKQTHLGLLATAEQHGFGQIIFTDHDLLPDKQAMQRLAIYRGPVKWDVGIEVSSGWPKELGGGVANMFHILGLPVDAQNSELIKYCQQASDARVERFTRTITNLQKAGFTINAKRAQAIAGDGNPGSPHVTAALIEVATNVERLKKLASQMKSEAEVDPKLKSSYDDMMLRFNNRNQDYSQLVYPILLSAQAFVPDIYVPYLYWLDMDQTVSLIRSAGGVAVLAHWPTVKDKIDLTLLESLLASDRLDGLEYRSAFVDDPNIETVSNELKNLAQKHHKLATIGIDAHNEEDFARFIEIKDLPAETVGQWQQILDF